MSQKEKDVKEENQEELPELNLEEMIEMLEKEMREAPSSSAVSDEHEELCRKFRESRLEELKEITNDKRPRLQVLMEKLSASNEVLSKFEATVMSANELLKKEYGIY